MKDTIKADYFRKVLKHEFLTDNALIEHVLTDENIVEISVRYITGTIPEIKEDILIKLTKEEYSFELSEFLKINEDSTAIALFYKNRENEFLLGKVYDITNHTFIPNDFTGTIYHKRFKKASSKVKK